MPKLKVNSFLDDSNLCVICQAGSVWRFEYTVGTTNLKLWYCEPHTEYVKAGIEDILHRRIG